MLGCNKRACELSRLLNPYLYLPLCLYPASILGGWGESLRESLGESFGVGLGMEPINIGTKLELELQQVRGRLELGPVVMLGQNQS